MAHKNQIVAVIDCNNFFVSCERVFNPKLEGIPVIALSNNDGCIIARSNEAKKIGIKMGQPFFEARELILRHKVKYFSSNYKLYGDLSNRVMSTIKQLCHDVEIYSIDEAFVYFEKSFCGNFTEYARNMRRIITQWTGIPVSIGVSNTKTLAKLANELAKKNPEYNGVLNLLDYEDTDSILKKVTVGDIWGVGRKLTIKMNRVGIYNAFDLKKANSDMILKNFSITGLKTLDELNGKPCIELDTTPPPKKGITCSRSFGVRVTKLSELKEAVSSYVTRASEKLRSQNSVTGAILTFVMTGKHSSEQYYNSDIEFFATPTEFTPKLINAAHKSLEKIYKENIPYKKAGVILLDIYPKNDFQSSIFETENPTESENRIMNLIDSVNRLHGKDSITFASTGTNRRWRMLREHVSPEYTTDWNQLLTIKI